jgi:hypothetical protein
MTEQVTIEQCPDYEDCKIVTFRGQHHHTFFVPDLVKLIQLLNPEIDIKIKNSHNKEKGANKDE